MRYRDPIFNAVTVTPNLTYGTAVNLEGQTITLQLDMYQPTGDAVTARPAIVWVHGGSFTSGNKTSAELVDEATTFSMEGFVNVSIDYRLESPGCSGSFSNCVPAIQEAAADAQTAVRFLRTNAATYGIDPNRIAIGGSSAGAITALNVGYSSVRGPVVERSSGGLTLGCAVGSRQHRFRRRTGPRLSLHHRSTGCVSVGREHNPSGEGSGARRVPRVLERDLPRAVHRAPPTDPRPDQKLLVVGDGSRPRGNLTRRTEGVITIAR